MKKQFKTPKFIKDAIKDLEEKEQKEWKEFIDNHSQIEIYYAQMYKDLFEIQMNLDHFKLMYGIDLKININKSI